MKDFCLLTSKLRLKQSHPLVTGYDVGGDNGFALLFGVSVIYSRLEQKPALLPFSMLPFSVCISISPSTKEVGRNQYHRLQKVTQSFTAGKGKGKVFLLEPAAYRTWGAFHFALFCFLFAHLKAIETDFF